MSHGYWTLAPSAEYGGECTLTFTANDPIHENDFNGLQSYPDWMVASSTGYGPYSHFGTRNARSAGFMLNPSRVQEFGEAEHIVFEGPGKTKLPENAAFMFGDWGCAGSGYSGCGLKSFKSNNALDTSHTTSMRGMFQAGTQLTNLDMSGWNTGRLENIYSMFDITGLTDLDLSGWDTHSLTQMHQAFFNTSKLKTLNLSGWDTSNVTDTGNMFMGSGLQTLTVGPKTDVIDLSDLGNANWLKVTRLSTGTSGTTQEVTDSTPQTTAELQASLTTNPARAGTYTHVNNESHSLNLNANLPAGYTASAAASGYTDDGSGNLSRSAFDTSAQNVPFPTYDTAQVLTNRGSKRNITRTDGSTLTLPTADPYTLTAPSPTSDTYTLLGWSTTPTATTADHHNGDTISLASADVTLYAIWKKDARPVHVTPPSTSPSVPSGPSESGSASGSSTSTSGSGTSASGASGIISYPAAQGPTSAAAGAVASPSAPTLAPAARLFAAAPGISTTGPAVPGTGDHTLNGASPNASGETPKEKICKITYYGEGSVAPAAVICKNDNKKSVVSAVPDAATRTALAPAWLFMLVLAVLFFAIMFLYQRRNAFFAAQHRAAATTD